MVKLSDSRVLAGMADVGQDQRKKIYKLARPFADRSHLRLAKEIILADNFKRDDDGRRIPDVERFDKLENHIRLMFGNKALKFDTPSRSATDMFALGSKILVLMEGKPRYLDELSEMVRGISSKIWRGRVYCEKEHEVEVREECNDFLSKNPIERSTNSD